MIKTLLIFILSMSTAFGWLSPHFPPAKIAASEAVSRHLDGLYEIETELKGGSGKLQLESPAQIEIKEDAGRIRLVFSSGSLDWLKFQGETYEPSAQAEETEFIFPVSVPDFQDQYQLIDLEIQTSAMSRPHRVKYQVKMDWFSLEPLEQSGFSTLEDNSGEKSNASETNNSAEEVTLPDTDIGTGEKPDSETKLDYATHFAISTYQDGKKLIRIADGSRFLVLPEGVEKPKKLNSDVVVLQQPIERIYLVASAVMSYIDALNAIDTIALSGTKEKDWSIENARKAMEKGQIQFAGKYSEPDYEKILATDCDLAVQSTMITHSPQVKEKLIELGLPNWVDYSSYESHPLGRIEWIKAYGALLNKEKEAQKCFDEQKTLFDEAKKQEDTDKQVAFFTISSSGQFVTRAPEDYIQTLIDLAGGENPFASVQKQSGKRTGSMRVEEESFFALAKDADILIYNATIMADVKNLSDLLKKKPLLKDFKAVKEGHVYRASQDIYQQTMKFGEFVTELASIIHGQEPEGNYLTPMTLE